MGGLGPASLHPGFAASALWVRAFAIRTFGAFCHGLGLGLGFPCRRMHKPVWPRDPRVWRVTQVEEVERTVNPKVWTCSSLKQLQGSTLDLWIQLRKPQARGYE